MAKQTSIITFSGRLNKMIGVKRKTGSYIRCIPEKVCQSPGTKRAAQRFGMASSIAAFIRKAIVPLLDFTCDGGHVNRLTKRLIPSGGQDIKAIKGYRFTNNKYTEEGKIIAVRIDFSTRKIIGTGIFTADEKICIPGIGTLIIINGAGEIIDIQEEEIPVLNASRYIAQITMPSKNTPFTQRE
ncbi:MULTISPECIES: hypothetical protein [unclassified Chitinophaga]|uniref:hypothetical protein n=1 Tax=unclassified Chitinophaga TaxID=2619133 RepID=UPI0009CCF207|nr:MULTISPECIES: hypothetical protein [unclassified Chitinophaga]OMP75652.1 hypothetical protein BW716_28990 [[Flexibacter] sp. ATCC 35208]WPV67093.1 hypothetical protein QQL36_35470 [Chitinophaga sp. LS1]